MKLLDRILKQKRKGSYEKMVEGLKRAGYVIEHRSTAEVVPPIPGLVSVLYVSKRLKQEKSLLEYTLDDILRDRPEKLILTDAGTGECVLMSLSDDSHLAYQA
jgi:hypothetical protein